jgi:hypothetical protein
VWPLLVRRVVDDSVLDVRIAAVDALAAVADGDLLADGGARETVQVRGEFECADSSFVAVCIQCVLRDLSACMCIPPLTCLCSLSLFPPILSSLLSPLSSLLSPLSSLPLLSPPRPLS